MATNTFRSEFHAIVTGTWDNCWTDLNITSKNRYIETKPFDSNVRKTYRFWSACIRFWIPTQFGTEFSMASNAFWPKFHTVFTCAWKHCWANLNIKSKKSHILNGSFELFDSNIRKTYGFWSTCIRFWIPTHICTEFSMASNALWPKFRAVFTCAWKDCWANLQRFLSGPF